METTTHIESYEALQAENRSLREKLALLEHELAQLKRLIFGTKSERFVPAGPPEQLPLFADEAFPGEAVEVPTAGDSTADPTRSLATVTYQRAARKKPVRQVLPAHLPREVIVIEPDFDTTGLKKIGEQVTETLDYRPAKLVVIRRSLP